MVLVSAGALRVTRLAHRAARHAAQKLDIVQIEDELARKVVKVDRLPRRGSRSSVARAVVLEVRSGHADAAYALTRFSVQVARISGRTA